MISDTLIELNNTLEKTNEKLDMINENLGSIDASIYKMHEIQDSTFYKTFIDKNR